MNRCIYLDYMTCKNIKNLASFGSTCIEADNVLKNEPTLCEYRREGRALFNSKKSDTVDGVMSNENCLYLFNGKCAHELCAAHNKSCVRNSGESCDFFMPQDTFKKHEEQEMPQTNCSYAEVENERTICTNPDNDKDYGEICTEIRHKSTNNYICNYHSKSDTVIHPSHYCQGGIECIKAIEASMTPEEFQGYCKGNVIKYCWRFREKNGLEDLKKAQVYLGWMIESKEKQEKTNVN